MTSSLTEILADYILEVNYQNLPERVIGLGKLSFLDWLGSVLRGGRERPGQIILQLVSELGGSPQATVLFGGTKTSAVNAALANGSLAHIVELDDVHNASIMHPGAVVIPAALAAAEMVDASGSQLLEGIVVGYDVALRIGETAGLSHYRFWHTTGTCGTFGATAAAGKILGLDKRQLVDALGNAGTQAAGLWEFLADGAMSKHLHAGKAAMNGMIAALLAGHGFTGATRILEGDRGFLAAMSECPRPDAIKRDLGRNFKILENCFKIYPSCRHTHSAVDVALRLAKEHDIRPEEVIRVNIETYQSAIDIAGNPTPASSYEAKFSLPFCVAQALTNRNLRLVDFEADAWHNRKVQELVLRTELSAIPEFNRCYPDAWPARVSIRTRRATFTGETRYPKGDPQNPVSAADLEGKFFSLSQGILTSKQAGHMIEAIRNLDGWPDMKLIGNMFG